MTAIHGVKMDSIFPFADDGLTWTPIPHSGDPDLSFGHYPTFNALAVATDGIQIAEIDLEEFKVFARKVLADELAEPPAPEWHSAKVIRGVEGGERRIFLRSKNGPGFITDNGTFWPLSVVDDLVDGIEIVVAGDE